MPVVSIHMPEQTSQTGQSIYLRKTSDGTLLNAGGDALTEDPVSSGRFTATVAEAWTELLHVGVVKLSLTVREGWLSVGATVVKDSYGHAELDSAARVKLDASQPDYAPATAAMATAIKVVTDKMDTGLVLDGVVYQFTVNMLANAPSGGGTPPTAAAIADAVWDEALSGHATAGSTGAALSAAGTAGDPWITLLPGSYLSGSAGFIIGTEIAALQAALAATTVTVTGYASIDSDGVLQLKRAETATLTFTSDSSDLVPDLSVANTKVILGIKDTAGRVWLSIEGTVLVATGLQSVRFVLTPALSLALISGHHNFDVLAIYGYDANLIPPYATLKTFTSGRVTVTDVFLDPLEL